MGNKGITLAKPKIGQPCNGCGICCQRQLCNTGALLLRKVKYLGEKTIYGQCPALISDGANAFCCGLVVMPERFIRSKYRPEVIRRHVSICIGIGHGCDEIGDDEGNADQEAALDDMMEKCKNDPEWIKTHTASAEMIQKF